MEASLVYEAWSRTARAVRQRNPVLKNLKGWGGIIFALAPYLRLLKVILKIFCVF